MKRRTKHKALLSIALFLGDVVCICLAAIISYILRFHSGFFSTPLGIPFFGVYMQYVPVILAVGLLTFRHYGLYSRRDSLSTGKESFLICKATVTAMVLILAFGFFYRGFSFSRLIAVIFMPFYCGFSLVFRMLFSRFQKCYFRYKGIETKVLIIGTGRNTNRLISVVRTNARLGLKVVGIVSLEEDDPVQAILGIPVQGGVDGLEALLQKMDVDEVILSSQKLSHERIIELILQAEKNLVRFKMVPDLFEMITSRVELEHVGSLSLLGIQDIPLAMAWNRVVKRIVDMVGSVVGIILFLPVMAFVALLIKCRKDGSVVFRQERVGEDGRRFMIYKFRTMRLDAEEKTGPVWAVANDPRTTAIGGWLRRLNLDEIPQLFNVLKGDMSLVGPRPERPHFVSQFKEDMPRYMPRHWVKSGITGWAQVHGLRGNTSLSERIKFDLYYIENWSLVLDLKILLMSIFALKNAY